MNLKEIKGIAKKFGIAPRSMKKAENNIPCFGTANGDCDQDKCLWRSDCLK